MCDGTLSVYKMNLILFSKEKFETLIFDIRLQLKKKSFFSVP